MDSWSEDEIKAMQVGGNQNLIDFFAKYDIPKDATRGNKINDTLSPTPPVECLSTIILLNFDKSSISPECAIANVKSVVSCFVIPFKYIAIINAAI